MPPVLTKEPSELRPAAPPRHVAIIMDGNGRWAEARKLPRKLGHRQGVEVMRQITRAAADLGIDYLTLYSFSSENWGRPAEEVSDLMGLLRQFVKRDLDELVKSGVEVHIIGERATLAPDIASLVEEAEARTRGLKKLKLLVAFNYGGRDEIVAAARALAREVAAGRLSPEDITKSLFARHLHTAGIPDPDLVIRTSGEQRLSNFLIWQAAYAELVFVDAYWPDFTKAHLISAIAEFHRRERRFGVRAAEPAS
jgi:undecaprenyl diphosphate synthase